LLLEANVHYFSGLDQRVDDIKTEVLRLIEQNCPLKYECRFRTVQMEGAYYQAMYQCPLAVRRLPDLSTTYLPTTQTCKIDYSIQFFSKIVCYKLQLFREALESGGKTD